MFDFEQCNWTVWPQTWKTWNTRGFLWTWKTQGIIREFCATSGKNCNKQSIFSSSFKYLCKTDVDCVNRISGSSDPAQLISYCWSWCGMTLDERSLLRLLFVVITDGKVSLWLWKSLENSGNFFHLLCGHPVKYSLCRLVLDGQCSLIFWRYTSGWRASHIE